MALSVETASGIGRTSRTARGAVNSLASDGLCTGICKYISHVRPFGPVDSSDVNPADTAEMHDLFDRNNVIYRSLESHTSVLIGRKGSGKTAYLRSTFLDAETGPID